MKVEPAVPWVPHQLEDGGLLTRLRRLEGHFSILEVLDGRESLSRQQELTLLGEEKSPTKFTASISCE
jgi:hypothetical protein